MKTIGILAPLKSSGVRRMLDAVGDVMNVRFEERALGDDAGIEAWFLHEANGETLRRITHSNFPSYAVIRDDQWLPCGESSAIDFSRHPILPSVLTDRRINAVEAVQMMALPQQQDNVAVLASKAGAPVWAMQEVEGRQHHFVSSPIPELNEGDPLFQHFHGKRFLQLLPLLLFLRTLTEDHRWEPPPTQACFMFDDQNLHWRTYGFVDFEKIAIHARMHKYHVCFATIPLDTWFIHAPTAQLFKQNCDQLSLLIHGNDHTTQELARPNSDEERSRQLRQALGRIDTFEHRSDVEVARVMVPPHGACGESTLRELANLGFEAACISRGSLRHYNGQATWLRTLGMKPSDIIGGLPVFPRFPFSGDCHNNMLLAALLHQPIIARGHHHDLAEGLQPLTDLSGFVNSLGTVHWANMKRISRSHYAQRLDGRILLVRMFTKRIEVCVPEGINQLWVERPGLQVAESLPLAWKRLSDGSEWMLQRSDKPIPVLTGQKIEIVAEVPTAPLIDAKKVRNFHLWPVVRRQLTEARDRLAPVLRRFSTLSTKPNKT